MRINPIPLQNQSQFINSYRNSEMNIMKYFEYNPNYESTYQKRVEDLKERSFDRKQLTNVLYNLNQKWDAPESTYRNINRLKDENSVVVIGGQQAGLLSGPMYTINKIISIIQFAKQQEAKLQVPVLPVFWIAGEDHDFDEINHIYFPEKSTMKKYKLLQRVPAKQSVSATKVDTTYANQWLNRLFEQLNETQYTKDLYGTINSCLEQSSTYVDFFARVIHQLFKDEGIILIDSDHPNVRQLESDYFVNMIENQPEITKGVFTNAQLLKQEGYSLSLEVEEDDAHLFYTLNNERVLLSRNENGDWVGKQNEALLTTNELVNIAKNQPELLSNNVVTRPLMQELLFPSLAFVGGPGEISYWSVLKPAFQTLNIKMPPVLPRLSFTYLERSVEKTMNKYAISTDQAINFGVENLKSNWLASQSNPPVQQVAKQIKSAVDQAHKPLRDIATDVRSDLGELADKNLYYLHCDIEYLEDRILKAIEKKYAKELDEFNIIQNALYPDGGLQERKWNPLYWINNHGTYFIKQLAKERCSFENEHYVVHI
ncbi:bacillithiol biosynthesis cysteine-adding enzyme BshC [Virgibacillus byunsanensis]|uniref:Putative cysteine ligase BshC n=1 Tax=Virgibacillus byunsanensis TaxID=570945 RepID=A0ABW3LL73_9BACI